MFAPRPVAAASSPNIAVPGRRISPRLVSFALIGIVCTAAFAAVFWGLRHFMGPLEANLGALSSTLLINFAANRRLTFHAHSGRLLPQAAAYALVYLIGLGASSAALWLALEFFRHPSGLAELALAVGASGAATVIRFTMLTRWVFRNSTLKATGVHARG